MDSLVGIAFLFLGGSIFSAYVGVKLLKAAGRRGQPPAIPVAKTANPEGADRAYAKTARFASKAKRPFYTLSGLALIAAPFVVLYEACSGLSDSMKGFGSKGRVLRINRRAQLAEPALGDGWADEPIAIETMLTARDRAMVGELWLLTARMEHASVAAFSQLAIHLSALGAPARLLEATHRAALEEICHARACFTIVSAITGERHTAGPILALGTAAAGPVDLVRLAIGSLIDGCLAEGIAADVAARSAAHATEPAIRTALTMIARDEASHAELAWDVLAWCLDQGTAAVRDAVAARAAVLDRELAPQLPDIDGVDDVTLARFGVIDQDALGELATARIASVAARAAALVARTVHARAA